MRGCFVLSALACVSVLAAPLHAQTSIEVGPLAGYYRPVGHFDPALGYFAMLPMRPSDLRGTAWGGNARLWLGRRLGVGASGMVTTSMVGGDSTPGYPVLHPSQARVLILTAEVLYDFSPERAKYRAWLGAGPGLVRHSGHAYSGNAYYRVSSFVDLAGVVGAGASVRLWPHVAAVGQIETALYNYAIPYKTKPLPPYQAYPLIPRGPLQTEIQTDIQAGFQEDLLFRFGVDWTWR